MHAYSSSPPGRAQPRAARLLAHLAAAGIAGLVVWEAFARLIAPLWLGFALDPTALIQMALGMSGLPALILHLLTGLVAFPFAYVVILRPLAARILPNLSWLVLGVTYGVALWVFAMYGMASLLGGAPPFLGFAPIAWASLLGHVLLAVAIAAADAMLAGERRSSGLPALRFR